LAPNNELAWEIFLDFSSQVRTGGFGGIIGFDLNALKFLFEAYEIPVCDWMIMIKKIQTVAIEAQKIWNRKAELKSKSTSTNAGRKHS